MCEPLGCSWGKQSGTYLFFLICAMLKTNNLTLKAAKNAIRITPEDTYKLILSRMCLTTFPKCLLRLTHVNMLDLSCNQINKLPDNIGVLRSLTRLDLRSNKLRSLPDSIGHLSQLTYLNVSNNFLTSAGLPPSIGSLTGLKTLNLGLNNLDSLPPTFEALHGLEELKLFHNKFVLPPDFLKALSSLTKVDLKGNLLEDQEKYEDLREKPKPVEKMILVHESILCRRCIKNCGGLCAEGKAGENETEVERIYPGLMVPNSVAKLNQDQWRIRQS